MCCVGYSHKGRTGAFLDEDDWVVWIHCSGAVVVGCVVGTVDFLVVGFQAWRSYNWLDMFVSVGVYCGFDIR